MNILKFHYTNYLHFFIISFMLISCSGEIQFIEKEPHFVEVDRNYLEKEFDEKDDFRELIKTQDYTLHYIQDYPSNDGLFSWDCTHLYFLETKNHLYRLEPYANIVNGYTELKVLNDSTLIFYTQKRRILFGDFWIEKENEKVHIYYDPDRVPHIRNGLEYKNGLLTSIGKKTVNIDSTKLKSMKNVLYKLEENKLKVIGNYDTLCLEHDYPTGLAYEKLESGVYYFSYPGRKIDCKIDLTNID